MKQNNLPVAIITGAGSGVGRAVAVGMGVQGYRVVLAGRRAEPLEKTGGQIGERGIDWISIVTDISVADDRARLVEQTMGAMGRVDAIVNNAAIGTHKPMGELTKSQIEDLFATNAVGPIELVRLALPELIRSKGCVVNVASVAMLDPFAGLGIYGCTKAAVDGLTRAVHNEYGEQGVRAFTVAPGAVETEMLRSIVSKTDLPTEHTLSAAQVAAKIIACITGDTDEASGSTIVLNSP